MIGSPARIWHNVTVWQPAGLTSDHVTQAGLTPGEYLVLLQVSPLPGWRAVVNVILGHPGNLERSEVREPL